MNTLLHKPEPKITRPFSDEKFEDLKNHITQVRRLFDWPGIPLHDVNEPEVNKFNRYSWHNPPLLKFLHHNPEFIALASELAGIPLKPSYAFLSMYSPEGICPPHQDRPQCQFTIDILINSDHKEKPWPIYVDGKPYILEEGFALFYSGTGQPHYRNAMKSDSDATKVDLAFFHFCPLSWVGQVE